MTLAEKASEDPHLRDLMKRVAAGEAKPDELSNFQKIIDQITVEYKRKGGQQGPSADRLLVDGRTVKYFADEVRTILDIVLATNPRQKSGELLPPRGSDPLVVALVRAALDDAKVRAMIRRIAENQPGFTDATDLKAALDKLHKDLRGTPTTLSLRPHRRRLPLTALRTDMLPNQRHRHLLLLQLRLLRQHPRRNCNTPLSRRCGQRVPATREARHNRRGNGDRYLFPKYSILEYLPGGQQVIASFLIVRKGSQLEYGGDAKLDYYQPVTIRIYAHSGRHLEYLQRVVAPPDEVRRYMDDVMDNMTRAEYVLLAMRLPRGEREPDGEQNGKEASGTGNQIGKPEFSAPEHPAPKQQSVLWGPMTSKFVQRFNKQWFDEWKKSEKSSDKRAHDIFREACEAVGRDPLDKDIEYEKMIELLAAKDAESSS
ncbi:hypothetical protein ColLi_07171 [Colletotrichum liriopes]|uniref:Uncharacterized protein n=1 Tax=Colletotrichum liriopes TaxID=708192 RepID=A0AA37GNK2_9PEZI|nr:hypothetical protein ColLi_07171 [Colletotrichum liriopes]